MASKATGGVDQGCSLTLALCAIGLVDALSDNSIRLHALNQGVLVFGCRYRCSAQRTRLHSRHDYIGRTESSWP